MKHILLFPFLVLLSCTNAQDETALFQDALSAAFDYLSTESEFLSDQLGVMDPMVFSTFATKPDDDVFIQNLTKPTWMRVFEGEGFDIEQAISIWEKFKGKDLLPYVAENHWHFLIPKDIPRDRGTNISFSAPVYNSDTSFFLFYMVFETKDENKEIRSHQYLLFGKTEDSWHWMMESRVREED